jgi:cytochrome c556
MKNISRIIFASCATAIVATFAFAQSTPEELTAAVEMRHANMKERGAAIGVLAKMAQGETPYDAAAASTAAAALLAAVSADETGWWLPGSENGMVADSFARPEIWTNATEFEAKAAAMITAAEAMNAAAGVDLAALQAALPAVGGSCGGCHEIFKVPEN